MTQAPSNIHIPYSLKNIPIIPKFMYQKMLIRRIEELLSRMRWKLFWSKTEDRQKDSRNTFGFKSTHYPPNMPELKPFEDDLISIVSSIEMKMVNNPLQDQMKEDIIKIKQTKEMIVQADKTTNLYRIPTELYRNHLYQNIQKDYRRVPDKKVDEINEEAATITNQLEIADRVEAIALKPSFLSLKDHKEDFPSKLSFRLINPTKTNLGKISKQILDRINGDIRASSNSNQWRSTQEVLSWFNKMEGKQERRWLKFDVEAFYPSISKKLLTKAINYSRTVTDVTKEEEDIIHHCRRSILVGPEDTLWQKVSNPEFDVTMGSGDGAEICELVGLFMLNQMESIMPKEDYGLYRDDGLCVVKGGGPDVERTKKKITKLFKVHDLKITTEGNTKVVDFLDVVLDLSTASYKPFIKPNATIRYVSSMSNHPPNIIKNLPGNITRRLSTISSGEEEFKKEVDKYQHALVEAGYTEKLAYFHQTEDLPQADGPRRKSRQRKVTWFNPPWSVNVKTNVAARFIALLKKHFPPTSPLYSLFNTKKVKVSYSTCPNMETHIKSHNTKLAREKEYMAEPGCNCRGGRAVCPLQGRCKTKSLVYKGRAQSGDETREYIGQTAITFKLRFTNHKASFVNHSKRHNTTLSNYFWRQKDKGLDTNITWEPVSITNPYSRGSKQCSLCLTEKATIARWDISLMLNKRSEVMKKCWHKAPHMLINFLTTTQLQPQPPEPDNLTIIQPVSQRQVVAAPPTQDPPDVQLPSLGPDPFTPTTPVPPDDRPEPHHHAVVLDEQPLPQRRSQRRRNTVTYQI